MDKLLVVNDIIQFTADNKMERILWINYQCNLCITIGLAINIIDIKEREMSNIIDGVNSKKINILYEDTWFPLRNVEDISDTDKKLLEKSWNIVQFIAQEENEPEVLMNKKIRRKLIVEAQGKFKIGQKTIYKYLRKYWQGGKVKSALISNYCECGGRGKEKVLGSKKIGRPNKICVQLKRISEFSISKIEKEKNCKSLLGIEDQEQIDKVENLIKIYSGINLTNEDKHYINTAIKRYYLNAKEFSLKETYNFMLTDFYSVNIDENGVIKRKVNSYTKIPTFDNFKKYYYKNYRNKENVIDEVVKDRIGNKNYNLKSRALKSNSTYEAFGPGFRYQIDATTPCIYIRNRIKDSIIGKAIVYFVIDVFSRLVVGVYIGIYNTSWRSASIALFNCIEDKVEFCKKYGISITNNEWPNSTLPENLLGDRGELVGMKPEKIIDTLKINIENTASWRADQKGIVEQSFNLAEQKIKRQIPGALRSEFRKRGERDYRLDAIFNIDELTKCYIRVVIQYNNRIMKNYPLSSEMIEAGIKPTPVEIWNWGIKNLTGSLRDIPKEYVIKSLMQNEKATITEKGIMLGEQYYDCNLANEKGWYSRARMLKYSEIECYYNERNMNVIYIENNETKHLEPCTLMPEYEVYKDKTYDEIVDYLNKRDSANMAYEDNTNQNSVDLISGIKQDITEAKKTIIKNKDNVKDIKINRAVEKEQLSMKQVLYTENDVKVAKDKNAINTGENGTSESNGLLSRLQKIRNGVR